jgi:carbon-monoxide dehydrogenase large subunit
MPTGEILADVTPWETLNQALATINYDDFPSRKKRSLERNQYRGIGICSVVESTTYGSEFYKAAGIPGSGHEAVWIRIEPTGVINASVGLGPSGQGYETAFSQVIAEGIGVLPQQVRILMGNSDIAPYGMGSRGARGGTAGGGAFYLCARQAHEKLMRIAAALLNITDSTALKMIEGVVHQWQGEKFLPTKISLKDISHVA